MANTRVKTPILKNKFVSNPFTVMLASFRQVISVNLNTFLLYWVVGMLTIMVGLLAFVAVAASFEITLTAIWGVLLIAALIIWGIILLAAFTKYSLETAKGKEITFAESIKFGYQKAPGYAGLMVLSGLIVLGGLILLIIPGLVFMYWFLLAPYIYIDQDIKITDALRQSKRLVMYQPAEIFGLVGAGIIFSLPGLLPVIGIVYSLLFNVVWYVAHSYRYLTAQPLAAKNAKKPTTDPSNYWAVGLAVLLFFAIGGLTEGMNSGRKY